jgi:hypothetical protein
MGSVRGAAVAVALLALLACGDPQPQLNERGDPLGPLEALADCEGLPAAEGEAPDGLLLPDGAIIQKVTPQGPLVNVTAYVPMTPVQFEQTYRDLGVEILITENEIFEAELLVSDGTHRNFLKAAALCKEGSSVLAVVAPEVDAEGLPVPQRAGGG